MKRAIRISITTLDGELLDSAVVELTERDKIIAFHAEPNEIPRSGHDESMVIGLKSGYE